MRIMAENSSVSQFLDELFNSTEGLTDVNNVSSRDVQLLRNPALMSRNLAAGKRMYLPILSLTSSCRVFNVTLSVGLSGSLIIFGIIGNTLSLIVLLLQKRSTLNTSINVLLVTLSFLDSAMLIIICLLKVIPSVCGLGVWPEYLTFFASYIMTFVFPLSSTILVVNEYIVVLIAFQRFLYVCFNRIAKILCKPILTYIQIFLIGVFAVLYSLPRFLEYRMQYIPRIGKTMRMKNDLAQDETYQFWYTNVSSFIVIFAVPLLLLTGFTVRLVVFLREAKLKRAKLLNASASSKKDDDTTLSLVAVVVVFCLTQIHNPIRRTLELTTPQPQHRCPFPLFYYTEVVSLLNVINYSVNFVLYFMFSRSFRNRARSLLLCRRNAVEPTVMTVSSVAPTN